MISKSLLVFGFLCVGYTVLILAKPSLTVSQNQNQTNYIKAEQYLYGDRTNLPVTVVGTSLSARLLTDSLPGFYNLAFGGMSVSDGLDIIKHTEQKPRILLLETNYFYNQSSARFLEPLFNPVNYYLKKFLFSFRSDKQPIALATSEAILAVKGLREGQSVQKSSQVMNGGATFQQGAFEELKRKYATAPDTIEIRLALENLKKQIITLQSQGVEIIFQELPINPALSISVRQQYARVAFRIAFPPSQYRYVPKQNWNFKTTDGIHMNRTEAIEYTMYLRSWYLKNYPSDHTLIH